MIDDLTRYGARCYSEEAGDNDDLYDFALRYPRQEEGAGRGEINGGWWRAISLISCTWHGGDRDMSFTPPLPPFFSLSVSSTPHLKLAVS